MRPQSDDMTTDADLAADAAAHAAEPDANFSDESSFDPSAPPVDPLEGVEVCVDPETVDEDGFVTLWNVAAATMNGKTELTRVLASKLLGFLCKQKCDFVFTSSTDAKYLDEWFERDQSLLYDWSPQSEKVDVVAQHAHVPAKALLRLLKDKKFNPTVNHNPRRADRVDWFTNQWCIG
jgi:hypothetical protein